jgi:multiple sugar transport system ATP-binding protein
MADPAPASASKSPAAAAAGSTAAARSAGEPAISLRGLGKHFGKTRVLEAVDLEIQPGELCVFVGPSGCGKSTLLRIIAGLEQASTGELRIFGRRMNEAPPSQREIAMVFQSYALYPHMTVRQNLAFGLRVPDKAEEERRISEAARMLQIEQLLKRLPRELSGGQRQRVAIGRAITRHPKIFLFDEPLSNLDAALRVTMRTELARLHKQLGTTMVYVTHDQVEAMTLADRIVVMSAGRRSAARRWRPARGRR